MKRPYREIKKLIFLFLLFHFLFLTNNAFGQKELIYKSLAEQFKNPPDNARPSVYYWWLGGNVDTEVMKEEIKAMNDAGISGFTIFEIGTWDTAFIKSGPAFLEVESLNAIKIALDEAGKFGMKVGLNTASSWNAGGTWINPEHAAKSIYYSSLKVEGGKSQVKLPFPEIPELDPWGKPRLIKFKSDGKPVFYKEITILAVPVNVESNRFDTAQIRIITEFFDPQTEIIKLDLPPGEWEILRYVCSNSGENLVLPSIHSAGPIVDHYDAVATEFHFKYIISKLESVLGDLRKTALNSLYMASYEAKGFTWTTTLPEVFRDINGYNVEKFLPGMFKDDFFEPELQSNFKTDFQRTLSELMINNFYKKSKDICNKYGLKNNSEAGGPGLPLHNVPVEPIKALGSLDIPRGEFWINHNRLNEKGIDILRVVKEVSSASNIYNRRIVEMEAFTTFQHWQEGPFEMKPSGDRAFCEGMNKVVVHGFTHNPKETGFPGIAYLAGTHFNNKQVWWPKIKPFNDYLSRVSFILQNTDFVADVLYYYGDTIPNYGGHKNSRFTAGAGYDYEIINTEILLTLVVKDGMFIVPNTGARFSLLALTDEYEINSEALLKLSELAKQGGVIIGSKPKKVTTRKVCSEMPDVEGLIDKIWSNQVSKVLPKKEGRIYSGLSPSQMLGMMNIQPDFSYPGKEFFTLDYIHYSKDDMDFYFIRNTTDEWISKICSFRQINKIPEFWNPVSGEILASPIYNQINEFINIPVGLAPYGSTFVVFKKGDSVPHFTSVQHNFHPPVMEYTNQGIILWEDGAFTFNTGQGTKTVNNHVKTQQLEGSWELIFPGGMGAPERAIFPKLMSWTTSDNDGIKYFSGTATYNKTFQYDINSSELERQKIFLDLGNLSNIAEVWLNEKHLGIIWTKPYRIEITEFLVPGDNHLVVEIANIWSNRLVGDALTGEKFTNTNITSTNVRGLNKLQIPWKEVPLIDSGLLGPVRLITVKPAI
jgi:hypothetical protein